MIVKNLRRSRENMELTQKSVSAIMQVDSTTISGWETGKDTIPIKQLIKYANYFDFSLDYLFGLTKTNTKYEKINISLDTISENLRKLRKHNNMTQKQVAEKISTTQTTYTHYETKRNLIPTTFLFNLTKIYTAFSIDELFNRKKK